MIHFKLPRLDKDELLKKYLSKYCRLKKGEIWNDPKKKHKVGCLDASNAGEINKLLNRKKAVLAVHDPPYNMVAFEKQRADKFTEWCEKWVNITCNLLEENASLYVWLGADQRRHFEPFPEFIKMMKMTGFNSRNFITMRNQRGYGTQKNWMSVRQELLYYTKGSPVFHTEAEYTDIKKVTRGYYKKINGKLIENFKRSKSDTIRAGNVWSDIQQVFYLMDENINGCYAQKPLKSCERIIKASSSKKDLVLDFFAHSGSTLLACEMLDRKCYTVDIDPIYCEISIRRLERFRETGKLGWQDSNPFEKEIINDRKIKNYLKSNYSIDAPSSLG